MIGADFTQILFSVFGSVELGAMCIQLVLFIMLLLGVRNFKIAILIDFLCVPAFSIMGWYPKWVEGASFVILLGLAIYLAVRKYGGEQ